MSSSDTATLQTRPSSVWSKGATDVFLQAHYGKDLSAADIGRELGITRSAVIGRAHRLGLTAPSRKDRRVLGPRTDEAERAVKRYRLVRRKNNPEPKVTAEVEEVKAVPAAPRIESKPVSIIDHQDWQCRAVIGQVSTGIALYCGAEAIEGSSYCAGHRRIYFTPVQRRVGGVVTRASASGTWR